MLRLPPDALRGGVFPADHLDHVGALQVTGAPGPLVYGPGAVLQDVLPTVRATMTHPGDGLAELGRGLAEALAPRAGRLIGPAWYGYVSADTLTAAPGPGVVRALSQADLPLLARLHEQTPPGEVTESGTDGLPAFGVVEGGMLLAVACLGRWRAMPTIGVLTHPRARRRGLAAQVVTTAAAAGLGQRTVVQYRAFSANTASISVARRCGFAHYCDGLIVDLPS